MPHPVKSSGRRASATIRAYKRRLDLPSVALPVSQPSMSLSNDPQTCFEVSSGGAGFSTDLIGRGRGFLRPTNTSVLSGAELAASPNLRCFVILTANTTYSARGQVAPEMGEDMPAVRHDSADGSGQKTGAAAKPRWRRLLLAATPAIVGAMLAACSATTLKHGSQLNDTDVQQVQTGMGEESVRMALGTPSTTSALPGGNAYYYISSTTKQSAFFTPEEVDRRVVAVYFNQTGSVDKVANYGLRDGQVFDFARNETPAHLRDKSFIARFFRGIGPKQKLLDE